MLIKKNRDGRKTLAEAKNNGAAGVLAGARPASNEIKPPSNGLKTGLLREAAF